jgi:hypothetical protein
MSKDFWGNTSKNFGNVKEGSNKGNYFQQSSVDKGVKELFETLLKSERVNENTLSQLSDRYKDFYTNGTPNAKQFAKFALDSLAKRQDLLFKDGVRASPDLQIQSKQSAIGLYDPNNKTLGLSTAEGINPQQLLPIIAHEGQHALEKGRPENSNNLSVVNNFLAKVKGNNNGNLPKDYLPQTYNGIKTILNNPSFNQKASQYTITNNNSEIYEPFDEAAAFGIQNIAQDLPFIINSQTNNDSRSLFRKMMKDLYQNYNNLDFNKPEYADANKSFQNRIGELKRIKPHEEIELLNKLERNREKADPEQKELLNKYKLQNNIEKLNNLISREEKEKWRRANINPNKKENLGQTSLQGTIQPPQQLPKQSIFNKPQEFVFGGNNKFSQPNQSSQLKFGLSNKMGGLGFGQLNQKQNVVGQHSFPLQNESKLLNKRVNVQVGEEGLEVKKKTNLDPQINNPFPENQGNNFKPNARGGHIRANRHTPIDLDKIRQLLAIMSRNINRGAR